ncbi:MAG TPA: nitronate monooxygenase, partial [Burkholderiaceae bacterium]|nr:nitronate monooxygenase [Burkholderiaceae bacterium]
MIATRLTDMFNLSVPVVLAPMGGVAGGRLAAAVSNAGGLGLVGGGYGDAQWLAREIELVREGSIAPTAEQV